MNARIATELLQSKLQRRGINASFEQAETLRRAELTLQRWFEQECGDSNDYNSWAIERDPETDKPYRVVYPHTGKSYRTRIADREAGARRRIAAVCADLGCFHYVQTDPRGCALYVSAEPFAEFDHSRGVACCA